jgi:hypothetical protein
MHAAQLVSRRHKEAFDALQADTSMLRERTVELRRERRRHIAALRESAGRGRAMIDAGTDED